MEKNGGSKLMQMQARFQQKQMQEREMKIASLYEAQQARALDRVRHSPSNVGHTSPPQPPTPHQPGKLLPATSYADPVAYASDNGVVKIEDLKRLMSNSKSPGTGKQRDARDDSRRSRSFIFVRQMFEERRTKAGIDKSYPLQPIHNTDRAAARKPLPNGYSKVTSKLNLERKVSKQSLNNSHALKKQQQKQQNKIESIVNGSGDLNHNHEPDLNSDRHVLPQSNGEMIHPSTDELDKADNNYLIENETFPEALAPTTTPRSPDPPAVTKKPPPRRSPARRISPAKTKPHPAPVVAPPRRSTSENAVSQSNKARGAMQRGANPVVTRRPPPVSSGSVTSGGAGPARRAPGGAAALSAAGSGAACAVCGRHFAPDRIDKHQEICHKAHTKKRKPFDALKHRLAGTEAEPFIGKLRKAPASQASSTKVNKPLNNNWRQKHEEFISAIRAAKQVQAHLNAGGKLSDLPPPPPSENPDYVSCPHCGRRFNQQAAERHIPKCASFQFNKPKPATTKRR